TLLDAITEFADGENGYSIFALDGQTPDGDSSGGYHHALVLFYEDQIAVKFTQRPDGQIFQFQVGQPHPEGTSLGVGEELPADALTGLIIATAQSIRQTRHR